VRLAIPVTLPLNPAPERDDDLAQWLAAAKAGDAAAFERILVGHEAMVLRIAYRLLGTREDAQDAAQEVFLKLYRSLKRIDENRALAPWLHKVTVNECRDLRRRRRESALEDAPEPAAFEDTAERLLRDERRAAVARSLRALSPKERAAVVLRDIEGLPAGEAAKALGISQATLRSHLSAARLKMRRFAEGLLRRRS
jgi:RNA polymerase sigma-70 factor (ECF subfamily)